MLVLPRRDLNRIFDIKAENAVKARWLPTSTVELNTYFVLSLILIHFECNRDTESCLKIHCVI